MTVDQQDSRVSQLNRWQLAAYETAAALWAVKNTPIANYDLARCCTTIKNGTGYNVRYIGKQCVRKAGQGTDHVGWGPCMAHGGAKREGRALGGWLMAHSFAEELDVSPWEALLLVIRITAGRLRYIEAVLGSARDDRELTGRVHGPDGTAVPLGVEVGGADDGKLLEARDLSWWVEKSELERDRLARVSKAAIDAGVAQLLIEKELRAGEELAGKYVKALDEMEKAGMPNESLEIARTVMRRELQLALES